MTIKDAIRHCARIGIAFGLLGGAAHSAGTAQMPAMPAGVRDAVIDALNKGDFESASKLLQNVPATRAVKSVVEPNRGWETLKGCGFYPQQTRLECTVEIQHVSRDTRPGGDYGGPVGGWGSQENVDFCVNIIPIDFNPQGQYHLTVWMPIGRGTVIVHDQRAPASHYPPVIGPWDYAVYRDFDPIAGPRVALNNTDTTPTVSQAFTYEVKAILWWNQPLAGLFGPAPGDDPLVSCNFVPTYGDINTFLVRGDPIR